MQNMPFRPVALADKTLFDLARAENPTDSCEQTFAVNFAYSDNYNTQIAVWNGRVAVYKPKHKILHYPIGKDTAPQELCKYAQFAESVGASFDYIYDAPPDYVEKFPEASEFFDILENDGDADYIYNTENLRELKGALLRKKRNHIKHFETANPNWTFGAIDTANIDEAREFASARAADFDTEAIQKAFANFYDAGFSGVILRNEARQIAGLAVFSKISDAMADVIFEKSEKSERGAAQMLVKVEAEYLAKHGIIFMNREQDLGEPNLRQAKRSLDPARMYTRLSLVPTKQ